jgi:hypothetical protein
MPNQTIITERTTQDDIRHVIAPMAIDLKEVFKLLEVEMMDIVSNAGKMNEEELNKAIVDLIGE